MPSNKRARSADDNMSNEEMTIPERSQDTHIIDDFTVQPVKPWKQYWAELGKLRRDVEAKGEGPPDIVPIEANKHVKNVPPAKGPAKKLRPIPGNGDTTSHDDEDDADDTEHDCGQNSDNDEFAEFNYLEHMDGMVDKVDPASPKKTLRTCSKSYNSYSVVAPGWLNDAVNAETEGATETLVREAELRHQIIAEGFFRSLGFRRVRSSRWLALSSNPEHPCRSLDAAADFELPTPPQHTISMKTAEVFDDCINLDDQAVYERLKSLPKDKSPHDPERQVANANGNTMLHYAAIGSKPRTLSCILEKTKARHL
ncbi:hypothetical protein PSPO01_01047 [Paraphaeosphaeria sporulosa]